ncbi:hypothetical protein ACTXT7_008535 [Hymenolepis weldensis]
MEKECTMTMPANATPYTSRATKNLVEENGWEVMHHPPYSPHLLLHQPIFIFSGAYRIIEWDKGLLQLGIRKLMARWKDFGSVKDVILEDPDLLLGPPHNHVGSCIDKPFSTGEAA